MKRRDNNREARFSLFEEHWRRKPHYCESCGIKLYGENKTYYHDHLLERSKYPDLELEIDNLFLVCSDCHGLKTNGFPTDKHRIAIDKAKERWIK